MKRHCLASSPRRYLCTEPQGHAGDHIAWARPPAGGERYIVDQWPNDA